MAEAGPVKPSLKPHGLSNEEKQIAKNQFAALQLFFDFHVPENIVLLTYKDIKAKGRNHLANAEEWRTRISSYMDDEGNITIRELGEDRPSFVGQLTHMLDMADLRLRDWNIMVGMVFVDVSPEALSKYNKIIDAIRYQDFDPKVIMRKVVRA